MPVSQVIQQCETDPVGPGAVGFQAGFVIGENYIRH